jgi:hypothetical protein
MTLRSRLAHADPHAVRPDAAKADVWASGYPGRNGLAPLQTRTCARCGRTTTFVLEDAAGGWYVCGVCGRFA